MGRKHIPKAVRDSVKQRFNGRCGYCGESHRALQIDHIIPIDRQYLYPRMDMDEESNLMPACCSCNNYKNVATVEQFRTQLERQVDMAHQYSVNFRMAERFGLVTRTHNKVVFYFERVGVVHEPSGITG